MADIVGESKEKETRVKSIFRGKRSESYRITDPLAYCMHKVTNDIDTAIPYGIIALGLLKPYRFMH